MVWTYTNSNSSICPYSAVSYWVPISSIVRWLGTNLQLAISQQMNGWTPFCLSYHFGWKWYSIPNRTFPVLTLSRWCHTPNKPPFHHRPLPKEDKWSRTGNQIWLGWGALLGTSQWTWGRGRVPCLPLIRPWGWWRVWDFDGTGLIKKRDLDTL